MFDFAPKFLMVHSTVGQWFMSIPEAYPSDTYLNPPYSYGNTILLYIKRSGKTVYWYQDTNSDKQLNYLNVNYYYVAIG